VLKIKTTLFILRLGQNFAHCVWAVEYIQVPHVFGKTFFGRRIDLPVILDFQGLIHPK